MAQEALHDSNLVAPGAAQPAVPHEAAHAAPAHAGGHDHAAIGADNRKTGIWLFLVSEVMFFTVLIAANMLARWRDPEPHEILNIPLTALNTFVLLTSSFTVVRAFSAIQKGNRTSFLRNLFLSMVLGTIFVSVQAFEYHNLSLEGLTLSSNLFGSTFFALTGFHGSHVIIGIIWLTRTFIKGFNGGFSPTDTWGVELVGLYWHFVDIVWILLFVIVYLI
jgi:heme/copper-type cytochrome/quinol oxidase subunit 3